uniref:35e9a3e9-b70f-49a7-b913-a53992e3ec57-CDS n=1 Tax=Plasmodiophora brassicae TaxID=37360 RepID=A0A3P3YWA3_PLABS|nr:35e9a3e9-b70f-49a7-b913-a53992e3ec57-CDS [Plasmodiophora brassicae]
MQIKMWQVLQIFQTCPFWRENSWSCHPPQGSKCQNVWKARARRPPSARHIYSKKLCKSKMWQVLQIFQTCPFWRENSWSCHPPQGSKCQNVWKARARRPPSARHIYSKKLCKSKMWQVLQIFQTCPFWRENSWNCHPPQGSKCQNVWKARARRPPSARHIYSKKLCKSKMWQVLQIFQTCPFWRENSWSCHPPQGSKCQNVWKARARRPPSARHIYSKKLCKSKMWQVLQIFQTCPFWRENSRSCHPPQGSKCQNVWKARARRPPLGTAYILEKVMQIKNVTSATDLSDVPILARKFTELPPSPGQQMPECMKSSRAPPPLGTAYILEKVMQIKNVTSATDLSDVPILARKFMELPPSPGQQMPECMKSSRAPPPPRHGIYTRKSYANQKCDKCYRSFRRAHFGKKIHGVATLPRAANARMYEKLARARRPPSARHIYSKKLCKSKMWQVLQIFQTCPFWRENSRSCHPPQGSKCQNVWKARARRPPSARHIYSKKLCKSKMWQVLQIFQTCPFWRENSWNCHPPQGSKCQNVWKARARRPPSARHIYSKKLCKSKMWQVLQIFQTCPFWRENSWNCHPPQGSKCQNVWKARARRPPSARHIYSKKLCKSKMWQVLQIFQTCPFWRENSRSCHPPQGSKCQNVWKARARRPPSARHIYSKKLCKSKMWQVLQIFQTCPFWRENSRSCHPPQGSKCQNVWKARARRPPSARHIYSKKLCKSKMWQVLQIFQTCPFWRENSWSCHPPQGSKCQNVWKARARRPPSARHIYSKKLCKSKMWQVLQIFQTCPFWRENSRSCHPPQGSKCQNVWKARARRPPSARHIYSKKLCKSKMWQVLQIFQTCPFWQENSWSCHPPQGSKCQNVWKARARRPPSARHIYSKKLCKSKMWQVLQIFQTCPFWQENSWSCHPPQGSKCQNVWKARARRPPSARHIYSKKLCKSKMWQVLQIFQTCPFWRENSRSCHPPQGSKCQNVWKARARRPPSARHIYSKKLCKSKMWQVLQIFQTCPFWQENSWSCHPPQGSKCQNVWKARARRPPSARHIYSKKLCKSKMWQVLQIFQTCPFWRENSWSCHPPQGSKCQNVWKARARRPPSARHIYSKKLCKSKMWQVLQIFQTCPFWQENSWSCHPPQGSKCQNVWKARARRPPSARHIYSKKLCKSKMWQVLQIFQTCPFWQENSWSCHPPQGSKCQNVWKARARRPPSARHIYSKKLCKSKMWQVLQIFQTCPFWRENSWSCHPPQGSKCQNVWKARARRPPSARHIYSKKLCKSKMWQVLQIFQTCPFWRENSRSCHPPQGSKCQNVWKARARRPPSARHIYSKKLCKSKMWQVLQIFQTCPFWRENSWNCHPPQGSKCQNVWKARARRPPSARHIYSKKLCKSKMWQVLQIFQTCPFWRENSWNCHPPQGSKCQNVWKARARRPPSARHIYSKKLCKSKMWQVLQIFQTCPFWRENSWNCHPPQGSKCQNVWKARARRPPSARHIYSKKLCKSKMWQVLQIFQTCPFWRENLYVN